MKYHINFCFRLMALVVAVIIFSTCSSDEPKVKTTDDSIVEIIPDAVNPYGNLTDDKVELNQRINDFSYRLLMSISQYEDIAVDDTKGNCAISPISLAMNLGMVANSADSEVRDRITTTFGVSNVDLLNSVCADVKKELETEFIRGKNTIIANSIWYDNSFKLIEGYADMMIDAYDAQIYETDMQMPATVDAINNWCAENTENVIPRIIDVVDPETLAMFINAFYFKAMWSNQFLVENTCQEEFRGENGNSLVNMMHTTINTNHYIDDEYEVVKLGFQAYNIEMAILKPMTDITTALSELNAEKCQLLLGSHPIAEVALSMPRFGVESDIDLVGVLNSMGIKLSGTLENMLEGNGYGYFLPKQKTSILLDEKGVTAAALTYEEWSSGMPQEHPKVTMTVDSPFIYFIRNYRTGIVLMAGWVRNL